jgi:hypothetical protein
VNALARMEDGLTAQTAFHEDNFALRKRCTVWMGVEVSFRKCTWFDFSHFKKCLTCESIIVAIIFAYWDRIPCHTDTSDKLIDGS